MAQAGSTTRSVPQRTLSAELGARGAFTGWFTYSVSGFVSRVKDAIVPYRDVGGRVYYTNAGRIENNGFELGLTAAPIPQFSANVSFTYANYTFTDYVVFNGTDADTLDGNRVPGVPRFFTRIGLRSQPGYNFVVDLDQTLSSSLTADDQNSIWVENWGAGVTNLRVSWSKQWRDFSFLPYVGLANLFDRKYIGAVTVNGFGGRVLEPSAQRNFYIGAEIGFRTAELEQRHRVTVDRHPDLAELRQASRGVAHHLPDGARWTLEHHVPAPPVLEPCQRTRRRPKHRDRQVTLLHQPHAPGGHRLRRVGRGQFFRRRYDKIHQAHERRVGRRTAESEFRRGKAIGVVRRREGQRMMPGRTRLHDDAAAARTPTRATRHLRQQLESALGRAEVRQVQGGVGVHHAHQGHPREIQPLGDHLGAEQDVHVPAVDGREDALVRTLAAGGIEVHARHARRGITLGHQPLELLGAHAASHLHRATTLRAQPDGIGSR